VSIELKPSRNWPGRTDLIHRTHPESYLTSSSPLNPEDIEELVKALTAAGHIKPKVIEQEELVVYGYTVVDSNGNAMPSFKGRTQQEAIDYAAEQTKDCKEAGIDWDYRVAAIVDQGGL
jgi:hypothetical protein